MRFNRLDLNLLVALDALLSEKSITRASRRLNLSQSATSGVLARLRDYFKDDLLMPVGRNLILTPLAVSLIEPVRDVLLQIQRTIEIKPEFDPATAVREFRIVASDFVSTVLLGELGRRIAMEAPGISLDISLSSSTFSERLERGEVELIILPGKYMSESKPTEMLFEETYTCIVWTGNELVGDTLTLENYMALGHVSSRFGTAQTSFEEHFLKDNGYDRRIEVSTPNFTSLPHFVIGTNRIATMHTRLARMLACYYPIRLIEPPIAFPKIEMCMQWNPFLENDPSHQWLRRMLAEVARAEPGGQDLAAAGAPAGGAQVHALAPVRKSA
ncbi:LysR family transcriptional regulator [Massilia norwichensis]|uniref:LysR family transcriptional regulator n=1 Tax=Massilia norwichensis TaxID=1442366 RepID=A0ABT2ADX5_9BURK|nr:LysR family transcriptional regulator [Massilia norwichensis]MCS0592379.1 LysR family transcriptional regulator [Massilia norwichensis]